MSDIQFARVDFQKRWLPPPPMRACSLAYVSPKDCESATERLLTKTGQSSIKFESPQIKTQFCL